MLTRKQRELLLFIAERLQSDGIAPSFEEMKEAVNLKSKSGVHRLINALVERGFLRQMKNRARALEVLRLPEDALHLASDTGANVVKGSFGKQAPHPAAPAAAPQADGASLDIPLLGRIAAGTPIEALQNHDYNVGYPAAMLSNKEHYALEVSGDSMVDAGILDGDTVIIERGDTAENGAIVVALVDDQEATLKRLRRKGASIALEAANPAYETRIFGPDRVKVQGRLVGLLRRY